MHFRNFFNCNEELTLQKLRDPIEIFGKAKQTVSLIET